MSESLNYLVNLTCPHCGRHALCAISGFGGKLAVRQKECRSCGREFYVHLYAQTSTEKDITDGEIASVKDSIRYLSNERHRTKAELLLKHEEARRLYEQALKDAQAMRVAHDAN
jgi:hypothetical protein